MLSAVVVLPTPPFRFTTATTLIGSSIAQLHIFLSDSDIPDSILSESDLTDSDIPDFILSDYVLSDSDITDSSFVLRLVKCALQQNF
jgi:hypothetical protein